MSKQFKMKGIESKDGRITLFEERVVFFPPNIITVLGSIHGEGSIPLLRFLGKRMGRRLVEIWEDKLRPKTLKEITEIVSSMTSTAGWGDVEIKSVSEDEIVLQLTNNVAETEDMKARHICDFLSGYFIGFGEYIFHKAKVYHEKCYITDQNNSACEFVIQKQDVDL